MNERVEAEDIALLLLRLVAGGGIIALAIMPLPGTPLVKGHTWPAVLLAVDAALVVAGGGHGPPPCSAASARWRS